MNVPFDQIANTSIAGAMLVVALLALRAIHQEHAKERQTMLQEHAKEREALLEKIAEESEGRAEESAARVQDSKDATALLLKFQQAMTEAIEKLHAIVKARKDDER